MHPDAEPRDSLATPRTVANARELHPREQAAKGTGVDRIEVDEALQAITSDALAVGDYDLDPSLVREAVQRARHQG